MLTATYTINDWYILGLQLNLLPQTLDKIKLNCQQDVVACHRKMLQAWLNTGSASWLVLSNALMSPLVHKKGLADEIAKNHPCECVYLC